MKTTHLNYNKRLGVLLILLGIIIYVVPFVLVAIDNLIGSTKLADSAINSAGLFFIMAGPLLALVGLLLIVTSFALRVLSRR